MTFGNAKHKNGGNLDYLKALGIELPPPEDGSTLYAHDLLNEINNFWKRYKMASPGLEYVPIDHMELLLTYPVSMCKRDLTDTLKTIIALCKFTRPIGLSKHTKNPEEQRLMTYLEEHYPEPSYEELSLLFNRSKATIFDAINEKEVVAKNQVAQDQARREARNIASQQLIDEERQKLLDEKQKKEQSDKRTKGVITP
jgi:hypothetical protein